MSYKTVVRRAKKRVSTETVEDRIERIVMTPRKKGVGHTCIKMERVAQVDTSSAMHVAGGQHSGIVINKETSTDEKEEEPPQLWLEFKVFLKNGQDNTHTQESRQLKFWFKPSVEEKEQMHLAQDFFKELVSPCEFPRDYVGFIKKIMKLMQNKYPNMKKVEVELKQLETIQMDQDPQMAKAAKELSKPKNKISARSESKKLLISLLDPSATSLPPSCHPLIKQSSIDKYEPYDDVIPPPVSEENMINSKTEITIDKVLELVESAYPNAVSVDDITKTCLSNEDTVKELLKELLEKGVVRTADEGESFTRVTRDESQVKRVKQMPAVTRQQQPTIAIITAQFCEKVAVDAMIENKNTFVRYKTEGESNVYTLGNIGPHRVVATKLPAIGHQRGAMIAAGNTTTRLLGTFQNVDYVILVGCGGGVPHFTDYSKHVRLGDIVVSDKPQGIKNNNFIYMYAEQVKNSPSDERSESPLESLSLRTWVPPEDKLQQAAHNVYENASVEWTKYLEQGLEALKNSSNEEADFTRPSQDTDRLYMSIGGNDVIEVGHPNAPEGSDDLRAQGQPVVHFGAIGSGKIITQDDAARQQFANENGILAFDSEFDSVVESVYGNRKDNYIIIRGIADYRDGSKKKEWQPYSALAAAAFMKAVINNLPLPNEA